MADLLERIRTALQELGRKLVHLAGETAAGAALGAGCAAVYGLVWGLLASMLLSEQAGSLLHESSGVLWCVPYFAAAGAVAGALTGGCYTWWDGGPLEEARVSEPGRGLSGKRTRDLRPSSAAKGSFNRRTGLPVRNGRFAAG